MIHVIPKRLKGIRFLAMFITRNRIGPFNGTKHKTSSFPPFAWKFKAEHGKLSENIKIDGCVGYPNNVLSVKMGAR